MVSLAVKTENGLSKKIFHENILLADALESMGFQVSKPCGGKGICARCKIKAAGGLNPPPTDGYALACKTMLVGEAFVDMNANQSHAESVTNITMPLIEKNPLVENGFGAAVDIGTTTIVFYIYKFPECECVKTVCIENPQTKYGADVLTRMEFEEKNPGICGKILREKINEILEESDVKKTVITGNTVMLHFFTGLDPCGMARYPFTPKSLFGEWYGDSYIMPCISPFVGADITAAILSCDANENKTTLLADLGTNGEMVLSHSGKLTVCSASAGPAFEAVGVKQGVCSIPGAINKVTTDGFTTISDAPPIGICGSGLADAIALLLDSGKLDAGGYLENPFEIPGSGISVFPDDVRLFQLAKSAVRSAVDSLLESAGITEKDIDCFCLAGGLGSCINTSSAVKTGLIPASFLTKTKMLGNAAGCGASMLLLNRDLIRKAEDIAKSAALIELAGNDNFSDKFIENISF